MQVVIDIPEIAYTACKVCKDVEEQETTLFGVLCDAVANGTPLPKGHGALIDRDELLTKSYCIDDWPGNEVNIISTMEVEMADVIIEADKGVENGTCN